MPHQESEFTRVPPQVSTQPRYWNQFIDAFLNTPTLGEVGIGGRPYIDAGIDAGILPHPTTDQSVAFNNLIDEVAADGGGAIMIRGVYRANVVLKQGVVLTSAHQQFGYEGAITAAVIQGVDDTDAFVIDTPVGLTSHLGLHGIDVRGPGTGTTGGGIRFRQVNHSSIKNVHVAGHQDQGIILELGYGTVVEDILAFNCLLNRTRSAPTGVVDIGGTDHFLNRVEANASLSALTTADLRVNAIAMRGSNHFVSNCVGEISDQGWYIACDLTSFTGCRGDLNFGHDWRIVGSTNQLAACRAVNGGRSAANTYDGFNTSGQSNLFAACGTYQSGGSTYKYGFGDTGSFASPLSRSQYAACLPSGFATAAYSPVTNLSASPMIPAHPIIVSAGATSINVAQAGILDMGNYGSATTVTAFTGGASGQEITIIGNPNVTIQHNTVIKTSTGANITLSSLRAYRFINFYDIWFQVGT